MSEQREQFNPSMLAKELGIVDGKPGEGQGRLLTWDEFWVLVEKKYWKNKTLRMSNG